MIKKLLFLVLLLSSLQLLGNNISSSDILPAMDTLSSNLENHSPYSYYNFIFKEKTVTYTGEKFYLEPTNLPSNVTVKYDKNGFIDAGSYIVKAFFYASNNRLISTKSARLTIEKARITGITLRKKQVVYDGARHKLELIGDLPEGVTASYSNHIHTDAGEYRMSVRLTGKNYKTSTRYNTLTILPFDISKTLSLKSQSFIYDTLPKAIFISPPLPKGLYVSYKGNNQSKIGNHLVTATITGSKNYTPIPYEMKATITITKDSTLTSMPDLSNVIFYNHTAPYTGSPIAIWATNLPEGVTVHYTKNDHIEIGSYKIIATFYYQNILIGTKTAMLTIDKARITGVKFNKKEIVYDGTPHEILLEGELPNGVTATYKNNKHTNAGEHKASVTLEGDNYISSTRTNVLTIHPIDLTKLVQFRSQSFPHNGMIRFIYIDNNLPKELKVKYQNNGQYTKGNHLVTATIYGNSNYAPMPYNTVATLSITENQEQLPNIDQVVFDHLTTAYTGEPIVLKATNIPEGVSVEYGRNNYLTLGTYSITASFYFKDILLGTKTATLTIEKARITGVSFNKKEVVYDTTEHVLLLEGELPLGVTATYKNNKHTNAGEHKASVTLEGDNYIKSTRSNTLTILPADITKLVSLNSQSFKHDGKAKSLVISGELPKELSVTYKNNKQTEVGNYTIEAIIDGSNNYAPMPYTMLATLSIEEDEATKVPTLKEVLFEHKVEEYTGEPISIEATNIPEKVTVTYDNNQHIQVGVYQITASFFYKDILLGTKTATLTIEKARITGVKFSKKEVVYDATEHVLLLEGELPLGVTATYKNNKHTNAGEHKASVTLEGDNYIKSTRSNTLTILPADITKLVSLNSQSFKHDGKEKSLVISGELPKELNVTYKNNKQTEVGNYTIEAIIDGSNNYAPMPYTMLATLSIEEDEATKVPTLEEVLFEHKVEEYTGEPILLEATNLPEEVTVTYDNNQHIQVGVYQITASFFYKDILLGTKTATLTIEKARITGVKFSKKEVVYDATEHVLLLEGELPLGVTATYKNNKHTNAGEHKASVTLEGDNYVKSTRSNTLTILPADITKLVSLNSQSFKYDGKEKSLVISGELPKELSVTYKNNRQTEVGNYTIEAIIDGSTNYAPMPYTMLATLSIEEDEATKVPTLEEVLFEHKVEEYTGEPISLEATNIPEGITVKYNQNEYINIGVYQITASFFYKDILLGTKIATLTIEKARITGVKFSKKEVVYDTTEHTLLLEGELPLGVTATYKNNKHTNAGEHKASVTLEGDNYVKSTRSNTLTILPADITKLVSLNSQSFKHDGKEKSLTISGELPKELNVTYKNNKQTAVGNYTIEAMIEGSANYAPMPYTMLATLSITKNTERLPSIDQVIFEHLTTAYTGEPISLEATNLPEEVTVTYDNNHYIQVGVYQITASFFYKDILLGTKTATLTIEKARITGVKFSKKEVIYDATEHTLLLEGELPKGVTATYKNNKHTNAGEHKASVTLEGDNYIKSTRSNTLTILPADITKLVSLNFQSFKHDGKAKSLVISGELPKELNVTYKNNRQTEVGNYTIEAIIEGSTNYTPMPYTMLATLSIEEDEATKVPTLEEVLFEHKVEEYTGEPISLEATNLPEEITVTYDNNHYIQVGVYQITASFFYKNILLGTKTATLTIEKARITGVKFSKKEVIYDATEHMLLLEGELPLGVTATYKNNKHTNAGEHKASVTLEGDNYVKSTRSNILTILPADITKLVSLNSQSFKHDGKAKSLTISGKLPKELSVTYKNNRQTAVGNYTIEAIIDGSTNYAPMPYTMLATLSIEEDEATKIPTLEEVLFEHKVEEYTGEPISLEATNLPEEVTVTYDNNQHIQVGVYQITASFFYKNILIGTKTAMLTIDKARITGVKFSKKEVVYDATEHTLLLEGELPLGVTATYKNNKHTNAGEHKASVTLEGDNYVKSTRSNTLTILPADITKLVSLNSQSFKHDGKVKSLAISGELPKELNVTYKNNKQTAVGNYTVEAIIEGSTNYAPMPYTMLATLSIEEDEATKVPTLEEVLFEHKVEEYTGEPISLEATNLPEEVTVTYDNNQHIQVGVYQITASFYFKNILLGTKIATLTIEKARITGVKFSKKEVIYDATEHTLLLEGELPLGVTATYKNNKHTNAGEHKASVTLEGDNYVKSTRSNTLTILPADITKLVNLNSKSFKHDGKEKSLVINGELPKELSVTYKNNKQSAVGNYTIEAIIDGSTNYAPMPYTMLATLSITKNTERLPSIDQVVFEHLTTAYTGEPISLEATNIPEGITVKYNQNEYINIGVYQITASFYFKNILLGTKIATLTIEKARITGVKFSKKEVVYDTTEHTLLLEGELPLGVTATYKNNKHTNAGEHKASVTLEGDNYIKSTRSNTLTILPADITKLVSLNSQSFKHDGKAKSLAISGELPQELNVTYKNNRQTEVGNYTIEAMIDGSNNYAPMPYTMLATLSITKNTERLPSIDQIVFEHLTTTYTGEPISLEATNIPEEVTVTYDNNQHIQVGVYQITASFYFKNILLGTKTATLTIEKARITGVKFSKKEVVYDTTEHTLLLEGELPLGVTATYKNNKHTNAGEHKASVTLEGDNYVKSTRSNTLTILPADITKLVSLNSQSFKHDGKEKSLTISGELPQELSVTYKNNRQTAVGNYTIEAIIEGSTNYAPIPYTMLATLSITKNTERLPSIDQVVFEHLTTAYTGEPISLEATNIPEEVTVTYDNNQHIQVGVYQITASFFYKNILLGTKIATLTIKKARITGVKFSKKEVVYDATEHVLLLEGELPLGVTATYKNNKHTNAGEHKASVTLEGDNYVKSTRSNTLTILPADITKLVSLNSQSFKHDGKVKSLAISGELPKELNVTYKNNRQTEVGNYTIEAIIDGSTNYTPIPYTMLATLSITKNTERLPSIDQVVFEHLTTAYTGEPISLEATNLPEEVTVTYDNNHYIQVGVYQVTASFFYKSILLGTKIATLTIEKARITGVKFSKKEVVYDTTEHTLLLEGELPLEVTATYKNNKHTNAGEHKASVTLEGDNYVKSTRSNTLTILPADITKLVSLNSQSFKHDGKEKSLAISGELPKELSVTYKNNRQTAVGNYTIEAMIDGSTNYTPIPYTMLATLSITKNTERLPSLDQVVFEHLTTAYTGEPILLEATNLPEEVTVTYDNNQHIQVGVYQVTASFFYKDILLGTKTATLTIEKARITGVKFSKKEVVYDTTEHTLLLEGELPLGVTATYKNNKHTNAGEHKASVTLEGDNYVKSTRSNTLTILPADITKLVSLNSQSFKHDGKAKSLVISGELPKELSVTYKNNKQSAVGNYTIEAMIDGSANYAPMPYTMLATLSITDNDIVLPNIDSILFQDKTAIYSGIPYRIEATNLPTNTRVEYSKNFFIIPGVYTITATFYYQNILLGSKSAILTIEKARVTDIKFNNKKITYNGIPHELILEGDLPEGVVALYSNNKHIDAGEYKASVKLTGEHYETSTRTAILTIVPADLPKIVKLKSKIFKYDGKPKSLFIEGNIPNNLMVTYENNSHIEKGTYTVKAILEGNNNYTPMPYIMTATLQISDIEIEIPSIDNIIFSNKKVTYDGNYHKIEATNLPYNITVEYDRNYYNNAGEYTITASFYYNSMLLGNKTALLTIDKAKLTNITYSKKTEVYNGKPHTLLITGKLPKGVSATYSNHIHTDAGIYKASVTLEGDNYVTSKRTTTLTIKPINIAKLISFKSEAYLYDSLPKTIKITGSLPRELRVSYKNNTHTDIGIYQAKANIEGSSNYAPMPYILVAELVIRDKGEAADLIQLSINDQIYTNPNEKISYILPCNTSLARLNIDQISPGAFINTPIEDEYLLHYPGTKIIPVTVKSQTKTLTSEYIIELIRPVPFEKVAIRKSDNYFEINPRSATNGGFVYKKYKWFRNNELVSTKNHYIAGAYSDLQTNQQVKHHLVLLTDKGETIYTCEQFIQIDNTNNITLYPNPIPKNKIVHIAFDMDKEIFTSATIELYTIQGRKVFETTLINRENTIQIPEHLQSGQYIAVIQINGQSKTINIILK